MAFLRAFFDTAIEALFPVHHAEREVLAIPAERALKELPRAERAPIPEACSIFSYKDERVTRLIWSIKYKKSRQGAAIAAYALHRMARGFMMAVPEGMRVVIVPMPVTRARRRERGFNQCELIMEEMEKLELKAAGTGARIGAGEGDIGIRRLLFARDLLLRVRHTSRQTMKDRKERLESIKDMFAVNEKALLLPAMSRDPVSYFILVIDDVITTGSTIRDAVSSLRTASFERAFGLSVAH